jgi:NADH-quinone oxidoreductase subunit J
VAEVLFYVLSLVALLGAIGVVLAKSAIGSVLSLLATFFALAVIYLLSGFQFLAAAQVIVYAGAILVLFLFVIMLLNLGGLGSRFELDASVLSRPAARAAAAVAAALALVGLVAAQRAALAAPPERAAREGIDDLRSIAIALFGRWSLAFQAISLVLLATMVAVIVLAKRQASGRAAKEGAPE